MTIFLPTINHIEPTKIVKNGPKNPVSKITLPKGFPADFESGRIVSRTTPWPIYLNDALVEDGKLVSPVVVESGWSSKDLALDFINNECKPIQDSKGQETLFTISKSGAIEVVKRRSDYQSHVISVLNGFGGTQKATAQLTEIGAFFNGYPKPVGLIRYFIQMIQGKDALVMDFFAGSGPSAHSVMEQNATDLGTRKYVLVQIPEPLDPMNENQKAAAAYCDKIGKSRTVAELTKERLRRTAAKIKAENPDYSGDLGFRVFKLDSSNIHAWEPDKDDLAQSLFDAADHLKADRSEQDILFELLLKLGLDLTVPIEQKNISGKTVHSIGAGVLLACLSPQINNDEVEPLALGLAEWHKQLAPIGETRVVFRDSAFSDDVAKTNLTAILQQHKLENVRSL